MLADRLRPIPLLFVVLGTVACAQTQSGLTIHNSSEHEVLISGSSEGSFKLAAGATHRMSPLTGAAKLTATDPDATEHSVSVERPPPGGEVVWSLGRSACFVEGDFSQYYLAADRPAAVRVLGMLKEGQELYTSSAKVDAAPGQRLPSRQQGDAVRGIVRVPCKATASDAIASGWLEMTLDQLQPR